MPTGCHGTMVVSRAGCRSAQPLDTDKCCKASPLLQTKGSWGNAVQRRLSDIISTHLQDLLATYAIWHPDR